MKAFGYDPPMPAKSRICEGCGLRFFWTEKEQVAALKSVKLDGALPVAAMTELLAPPRRCRKCRTEKR